MDETLKRKTEKSRNLNEKKRRDQFNNLICELNSFVLSNNQKTEKSIILKTAVNTLKTYHENVARAKENEITQEWKPSFLTNEEYTYLMLDSTGGSILVFSSCGKILHISSNFPDVGYSLGEILTLNIYDLISPDDRSFLKNMFFISAIDSSYNQKEDNPLQFNCQFSKKTNKMGNTSYEPVEFIGCIKKAEEVQNLLSNQEQLDLNKPFIFVGLIRLLNPQIYNDVILQDHYTNEFTSHHNFEWKFLFLDERAPPLIGYSSFEVLGTSSYDYYHVDDLENVVAHHKSLMVHDEGVSGYYRFMTKGHQWIWLKTKSYVNRKHWNSRIEFIVCTHRIVNPMNVKVKNDNEFKIISDSSRSTCSISSVTDCSSTSVTSLPSITSESNGYEDENNKDSQSSEMYEDSSPEDDNSLSLGSISTRGIPHQKKRKIFRKFKIFKGKMDYSSSDVSSSYPYSFPGSVASSSTESDISQLLFDGISNSGSIKTNSPKSEDTLCKRCFEFQPIIADRTEELMMVSEKLNTACTCAINQQNNTEYMDDMCVP